MNNLHQHLCPGLKGNNPLHFLASLGIFRLLCLHDSHARMGWNLEGSPFPVYQTTLDKENFCKLLAEDFGWDEQYSKALEELPKTTKSKKNYRDEKKRLDNLQITKKIHGLYPITNGKNRIEDYSPKEYRELATKLAKLPDSESPVEKIFFQLDILAACGSDVILKGENTIQPSHLSFSNGAGGQLLLKDFTECALIVSPTSLRDTFSGKSTNSDEGRSLNWDPADQRSYAFLHGDPGDGKNRAFYNRTINALAFFGFSCFPSVPGKKDLRTAGFFEKNKKFRWPLWEPFIAFPTAQSLILADFKNYKGGRSSALWLEVERFALNKRFFFSPSTLVTTEEE